MATRRTPAISADGRYVAFESSATNLSPDDTSTNGTSRPRPADEHHHAGQPAAPHSAPTTGSSTRRSPRMAATSRSCYPATTSGAQLERARPPDQHHDPGEPGKRRRGRPGQRCVPITRRVSADGRYVSFFSYGHQPEPPRHGRLARRLRPRPAGEHHDARQPRERPYGREGNDGYSFNPSHLGRRAVRRVPFDSTNLSSGRHRSQRRRIYVRDRRPRTTTLASRATGPRADQGESGDWSASISADGRFVAFSSSSLESRTRDNPDSGNVYVARSAGQHHLAREPRHRRLPAARRPPRRSIAPLTVAYQPCSSATRVHAPPLGPGSCPATRSSSYLTVGTADANGKATNFGGAIRLKALTGDLSIKVDTTDIRNAGDLSDYTGELRVTTTVRATDKQSPRNAGEMPGPATVVDKGFGPTVPCTPTPTDTTIGSTLRDRHDRQRPDPGSDRRQRSLDLGVRPAPGQRRRRRRRRRHGGRQHAVPAAGSLRSLGPRRAALLHSPRRFL